MSDDHQPINGEAVGLPGQTDYTFDLSYGPVVLETLAVYERGRPENPAVEVTVVGSARYGHHYARVRARFRQPTRDTVLASYSYDIERALSPDPGGPVVGDS